MGGLGSGRNEYASTPTVEECRNMAIDKFKEITKRPDTSGYYYWGDREDPDSWLNWYAVGERETGDETRAKMFVFKYTLMDSRTDESESVEYAVPLEYTECNFGGVRPWFRCPGCDKRRGKLYLPPRGGKRYLCRECYDLGYHTSRTSGDDLKQAELRYRRAFAKADKDNRRPHPNGEPWFPERPKGMHHDTFEELTEQVEAARQEWDEAHMARLRTLAHRSGAVPEEGPLLPAPD